MAIFLKSPRAVLEYGFDLDEWLEIDEHLTLSEWEIPVGIESSDESDQPERGTVVWLGGGTLGEDYEVSNYFETDKGRSDTRIHIIKVRKR